MPKTFAEGIFILIPKSDAGEYRGIALLEILYKVISSIVNSCLLDKVEFNDLLHGNRPSREPGNQYCHHGSQAFGPIAMQD